MNMISKFAAAAVATAAFAMAAPASAAVYISFDGVTDAYVDLDDGVINANFGALGGFANVLVQGNADSVGQGILHSTAVEVTSASTAASLTIWVTRTGFTPAAGLNTAFFSSTNNNNAAGFTTNIQHYYSASDQKYGGTLLSSLTKVGLGGNYSEGTVLAGAGPYSWTQKYTITATSGAAQRSASPTALAAAVPEPGTWALMILGFGGAGAMIRRRRLVAA